jgi:transposase-like protein
MMNPGLKAKEFEVILESIIEDGLDGILPAMKLLIDFAMKQERSAFLQAAPYERNAKRIGYANGYKPKTIHTRLGSLTVEIPQVRGLKFYPRSLEKGSRSEKALKLAIAEMYLMGVSTRKVTKITEELCGYPISSTQVSRLTGELDDMLTKFRHRPLGAYAYVYLDARYEKGRYGGTVRDLAVLTAVGVNPGAPREVLGVSILLSEAEVHWRDFLKSLVRRGLHGVKLIISDDHEGLKAARRSVFPSVLWQRCQFHLQKDAQAYVPKREWKKPMAQVMRDIFNAPDSESARALVKATVQACEKTAPDFATWLEENIEDGLTFFAFPRSHWRRIRTTNGLERINREIRRRTRVVSIFPNKESCLRLVTAILQEIHEEWMVGRMYLGKVEQGLEENPVSPFYRKTVA